PTARRFHVYTVAATPTATTLSLHDALPICRKRLWFFKRRTMSAVEEFDDTPVSCLQSNPVGERYRVIGVVSRIKRPHGYLKLLEYLAMVKLRLLAGQLDGDVERCLHRHVPQEVDKALICLWQKTLTLEVSFRARP